MFDNEHISKKLEKNAELIFKMYIDFDWIKRVFYHNFYFDEFKFVLKITLTPSLANESGDPVEEYERSKERKNQCDLKWERFNLSKYVYLLYYE